MTAQPVRRRFAAPTSTAADDLAEALNTFESEPEGFACDTEPKAVWASRRLLKAQREIDERTTVALAEIDKVHAWLADANAAAVRDVEHFESHLLYYVETVHRADPEKKTVKLPDGVQCTARKQPEAWEFDADKFIPWARANAKGMLREVPASTVIEVAAVKASAVGKTAPGVTVTTVPAKYAVKVDVGARYT